MASPRSKELQQLLTSYYHQPITRVSMELFLSVGLVMFLIIFAIQPTISTMIGLISEIDEKKEFSERLERKLSALQSASQIYTANQQYIPALNETIPQQPNLIRSLKIIEKIGSDSEVIIRAISVSRIPDEAFASSQQPKQTAVDVSVSLSGDYLSIRNFITNALQSRRILMINSVSFSIQDNRGDLKLVASINITMPYYTDEPVAQVTN
jgi:hypothetical protein